MYRCLILPYLAGFTSSLVGFFLGVEAVNVCPRPIVYEDVESYGVSGGEFFIPTSDVPVISCPCVLF